MIKKKQGPNLGVCLRQLCDLEVSVMKKSLALVDSSILRSHIETWTSSQLVDKCNYSETSIKRTPNLADTLY